MVDRDKIECDQCGWAGYVFDLLTAKNPFDPQWEIRGCPNCLDPCHPKSICDEPGCWDEVSGGWPDGDGYRNTCYAHRKDK